jgi:hypothetical protein
LDTRWSCGAGRRPGRWRNAEGGGEGQQALEREAGGDGEEVLLGGAAVEEAARLSGREVAGPCGLGDVGVEHDEVVALGGELEQGVDVARFSRKPRASTIPVSLEMGAGTAKGCQVGDGEIAGLGEGGVEDGRAVALERMKRSRAAQAGRCGSWRMR